MNPTASQPMAVRAGRSSGRAALAVVIGLALLAVPVAVAAEDATSVPELEPSLEMLWEVELDQPWGTAIDPDGRIWVSTGAGVFEIVDRDGNHVETWGAPGAGDGEFDFVNEHGYWGDVAFRPDGGFYVTDTDNARIQEFDAERAFVGSWGSFGPGDGQFVGPDSIALDAAGSIYVLDNIRGDIQVFDAEGNHLRTFGGGEVGPFIDVAPDGTVYAVDESVLLLNAYRPDGSVEGVAVLSGLMSFATGIAGTWAGRMFVASELSGGSGGTGPEHLAEVGGDGSVIHLWPNGGWNLVAEPDGDRLYIVTAKTDTDDPTSPQPVLRAYALPAA